MLASLGIAPHSCVYLSAPITTGPALLDWKRTLAHNVTEQDRAYWVSHRKFVIKTSDGLSRLRSRSEQPFRNR